MPTYLRSIGIERAVINIHEEVNRASKGDVLGRSPHSRISEEERHGTDCTDGHGVLSTEPLEITHESSGNGSKDAHRVSDHVISPLVVRTRLSNLGSATGEEVREEYVEKRVRET